MTKPFKLQIPTDIVRSKEYTAVEFILLAKLIQRYYQASEKSLTVKIDHKVMMYYLIVKENDTFKELLKGLYEKDAILNKIEALPRKGEIEITLNKDVIPELNKEGYFTQLHVNVFNRSVIEAVGHIGIRILYYYQSHINAKDNKKKFCFVSEIKTAADLGITEKTVIKYNKLLEKKRFIKIEQHEIHNTYEFIPKKMKSGKVTDGYEYKRFNNHYFIRQDKIDEFCEKKFHIV